MDTKKHLETQLRDCFKVIDSCLACFYLNQPHMYKPLAGQLRILLCDSHRRKDNSLLPRVFPDLIVSKLKTIDWSKNTAGSVQLRQGSDGTARIASMPYEITQYTNGLVVADLLCDKSTLIDIPTWMDQDITIYPTPLTARDIVRHVADKGGGSHVDTNSSPQLRYMAKLTPTGQSFGALFVLALGRFAQIMGEKLFNYTGPKVDPILLKDKQIKYTSIMAAHADYAHAIVNRHT